MSSRSVTRQNSSEVSSSVSRRRNRRWAGVHGVLNDPHGDRRAVGLAPRVQPGQVAAVGQHPDRGQLERGRGPPQDVRPGGQHVAGQGVGQEVAVGQHQHPRSERGQQVPGQGLLADGVGAQAWPRPAPRCPTRPRPASGPAGTPRPGPHSTAARSARHSPSNRARRWWSRPPTPRAARSRTPQPRPRRRPGRRPRRTACAAGRRPTGSGPGPGWRCSVAATAGRSRRRAPNRAGRGPRPATARRGGGDTARPPA